MGSLRAKQASPTELLEAVHLGQLRGLTVQDRLLAEPLYQLMQHYRIDDTCKLYLPFDETSGATAHDLSGNGNTGIATGTTIVPGVFGKCRALDGTNRVDCGSRSLGITTSLTVMLWVNFDVLTSGSYYTILSFGGFIPGGYLFQRNGANVFLFGWGGSDAFTGPTFTTVSAWKHLVVVIDSGVPTYFYVNAVPTVATRSLGIGSFSASDPQNFEVGRRSDSASQYCDGSFDEPRIYSRALSADEIYLHYLAGALKLGLI